MYKLNRKISAIKSYRQADAQKKFDAGVSLSERLNQAWYLTAMAYGIDPEKPSPMEKRLVNMYKRKNNG